MTDRHAGYLVTLEEDIREDDAEPLIEAMKQLKGVVRVEPVGSSPEMHLAKLRAKRDIKDKLWEAFSEF